jgi:hypothetical protein
MKLTGVKQDKEYVYLAYDGRYYKIGKANKPEERIKSMQTANPFLKLIGYGNNTTERHLHNLLYHTRIKGEFFNLTGAQAHLVLQFIQGEINSLDHPWIKRMRGKASTAKKRDGERKKSNDYVIPFGKYKGKKIKEIDDIDYCSWIINNVGDKKIVKHFKVRYNKLNKKYNKKKKR